MNHSMICSEYEALLGGDLEGDLSREDRQRADAHVLECARCAALRAELLGIASAAGALPVMSPSRDLWDGISSRIEAPVTEIGAARERVASRRSSFRIAAAAAALVVVTAGTTWFITRGVYDPGQAELAAGASTAPLPASGESAIGVNPTLVADARRESDEAFDRELVQLRALLEQRRANLDSATVALLERNLQIIDKAIAESRTALAKDPGSALLNRQLHNALGKKVQVLRSAALLPVETN